MNKTDHPALQKWLTAVKTRTWEKLTQVRGYPNTNPNVHDYRVRLYQNGKTVSVGWGVNKKMAIDDALFSLPARYK